MSTISTSTMSKYCVHIISVNIRGLKNKEKRQIVYNCIKNQKVDILAFCKKHIWMKRYNHI